ncbi:hypothetical protein FRC16_011412 [Serendipita sp. 398]|nr:hypothetical protein FRC16_011412 [Serendipita sp. 398]
MSGSLLIATTAAMVVLDQPCGKGTASNTRVIPHRPGVISCAAWNGEGDALFGFRSGKVERLDREGASKGALYASDAPVVAIVLKDPNTAFIGGENKIATLNIETRDVIEPIINTSSGLKSLDFCSEKGLLSITTESGVLLHSLSTNTQVSLNLRKLASPPAGTAFHPSRHGTLIVFGGSQLAIYDVTKPNIPLKIISLSIREPILDGIFLTGSSKSILGVATLGGEVNLIDIDNARPTVGKFDVQEPLCRISCLNNGRLVVGTHTGRVLVQNDKTFSNIWSGEGEITVLAIPRIFVPSRSAASTSSAAKSGSTVGNAAARKLPLSPRVAATRVMKTIPPSTSSVETGSDRKETKGTQRSARRVPSGTSEKLRGPTIRSVSGQSTLGTGRDNESNQKQVRSGTLASKTAQSPSSKFSPGTLTSSSRVDTTARLTESPLSPRKEGVTLSLTTERTLSPDLPGVSDISAILPVRGTPATKSPISVDNDNDTTIGTAPESTGGSSKSPGVEKLSKARSSVERENNSMVSNTSHVRNASKGDRRTTLKPNSQQVGSIKQTPLRNKLANNSLQVSPMHSPARTPMRQSIEAKEFIRDVVRDAMREREDEQRDELRALHLDVVKIGRLWKTELRTLMQEHLGDFKALQEENQRLRAENERLRRGY